MVAAAAMEARVCQVIVAGRNVIWVCYVQLSNEKKGLFIGLFGMKYYPIVCGFLNSKVLYGSLSQLLTNQYKGK